MFLRVVAAPGEVQDHRIAALEFRQPPALAGVIGELIIGERRPGSMSPRMVHPLFLRASALAPTRVVRKPCARVGAATLEGVLPPQNFSQVSNVFSAHHFPERPYVKLQPPREGQRAVVGADASPLRYDISDGGRASRF
jgi:hypothetical protein